MAGSEEAIAEAGGAGLLAGDGAAEAAAELSERARELRAGDECRELTALELGLAYRPGGWARAIAPLVSSVSVIVLPASPDGRDLAPRLASVLGRPLLAGAVEVTAGGASLAWRMGRQIAHFKVAGPFVATLLPGSRSARAAGAAGGGGVATTGTGDRPAVTIAVDPAKASGAPEPELEPEPELVELIEADPCVVDLAEAERIVAAGAGIGDREHLELLGVVAARLGACVGATRVVTDAGWLAHDRQIGTTGVSVRPRCYVAFGISGAAQHLGGLGGARHVVSINTDPSCPMAAMADLALVADAQGLVETLAYRLSGGNAGPSVPPGGATEGP